MAKAVLRIINPGPGAIEKAVRSTVLDGENWLVVAPSSTMRCEIERILLRDRSALGGLEVASLAGLVAKLSNRTATSAPALRAAIHLLRKFSATGTERFRPLDPELRLFDALRQSSVAAKSVQEALASLPPDSPDARMLRLYLSWLKAISEHRVTDQTALLEEASRSDSLTAAGIPNLSVLAVGFYSLTPVQTDFFAALTSSSKRAELILERFPGDKSQPLTAFTSFADVRDERATTAPASPALLWHEPDDRHSELVSAARWCRLQLQEGSTPADLAVVFPSLSSRESIERVFSRFELPVAVVDPTADKRPASVFVRGLAKLLAPDVAPDSLRSLLDSPFLAFTNGVGREVAGFVLKKSRIQRAPVALTDWASAISSVAEQLCRGLAPDDRVRDFEGRYAVADILASSSELGTLLTALQTVRTSPLASLPDSLTALTAVPCLSQSGGELAAALTEFSQIVREHLDGFTSLSAWEAVSLALDHWQRAGDGVHPGCIAISSLLSARFLLRSRVFVGGLEDRAFPFKSAFLPISPKIGHDLGVFQIDRLDESRMLYFALTRRATSAVLSCPVSRGTLGVPPSFYYYLERTPASPALDLSAAPSSADPWVGARALSVAEFLSDGWASGASACIARTPLSRVGLRGMLAAASRYLDNSSSRYAGQVGAAGKAGVASELADCAGRRYSVSQLEQFAVCPLRFFFASVARLGQPLDETEQLLPARQRGDELHALFSSFYNEFSSKHPGRKVADEFDNACRIMLQQLDALIARLRNTGASPFVLAWFEGFRRNGGISGVPLEFLKHEAVEQLAPPTATEKPVSAVMPPHLGGWRLHGRIDRLCETGQGIEVYDYKTGAMPSSKELRFGKAVQLPLYTILLDGDKGAPVSFYHYALTFGTVGRKVWKNPTHDKVVAEAISSVKARLPQMADAFRAGNFQPATENETKYCPYADLCGRLCAEGAVRDEADEGSEGGAS